MKTPLLTPEKLREDFGFSINPSQETRYKSLIETATEACLRFIGRELRVESYIQFSDGNSQVIVLDETPVIGITGVYLDSNRQYHEALPPSQYRLTSSNGILTIYTDLPQGRDFVKITYTAGYTEVPEDVLYAIAMTVQYLRTIQQADLVGVNSRSVEGGTQSIEQSIPPLAVKNHLQLYQRVKVR